MHFPVSLHVSALLTVLCVSNCDAQVLNGTAARPQLSTADARTYTADAYLTAEIPVDSPRKPPDLQCESLILHLMCVIFGKKSVDIHPGNKYSSDLLPGKAGRLAPLSSDNWDPSAGVGLLSADYRVAADGSAPFKSVQAAVDRAVADGGTVRRYISVAPGTYRELLCIPSAAPPITLFGLGNTRSDTLIVFNNANPTPKLVGTPTHPCASNAAAAVTGTSNSATVTVRADAFQARNLTVANDYVEDTYASHNQSAVALAVRGDKALFENVAVLGNQDTLMVSATAAAALIRAYFKDSLVQGDTDFIFGSGIAVFSHSTIRYDANRLGGRRSGYIFAPSTKPDSIYGFLATDSIFDAIGDVACNSVYLGRAWDQGIASLSDYVNGTSPNGQVTIRNSTLGAHIRKNAPWTASSAAMRPYCSAGCTYSANRFYEYSNSGAGSTN